VLVVLLYAFGCSPVSKVWNPRTPGKCVNQNPGLISFSIISVLADLSLIMIVFPRVIGLKIPRLQKIGILLVVNLGWIAIIASILRSIKMVALVKDPDFTWNVLDFIVWSGLDSSMSLTCAAASTLKPLLRKLPGSSSIGSLSQRSKKPQTTLYWDRQELQGETKEKQSERRNENNLEKGLEIEHCSVVGEASGHS
jgi:hypothetical protein